MMKTKPVYNYDLEQCNQSPTIVLPDRAKYCFQLIASSNIYKIGFLK